VFVAYCDTADSNVGKACLLSISGKTVTCSDPVVFYGDAVANVSVCKVSSDRAAICFENTLNDDGMVIIAKVISDAIYFGGCTVFSGTISDVDCCLLDTDKLLVVYGANGVVVSLDGINVDAVSAAQNLAGGAAVSYFSVCSLDTDKAIYAFEKDLDSKGYANIIEVSGTTITGNGPYEFEAGETNYVSVEKLSSSVAVVSYKDVTNSNYGTACALGVSGHVITPGTPVVFESAQATPYKRALARIDASTMMVCYQDRDNSSYGTGCVLSISGTTITAGTPAVFVSETFGGGSLLYLKQRYLCCCYGSPTNYGSPTKGYALILDGAA
jgi:hypothetical protein